MGLGLKVVEKEKYKQNKDSSVRLIRLRGGQTAGEHQELIVTLQDGTLVRMSRNHTDDTFQFGAAEQGEKSWPTFKEITPSTVITCQQVYRAFKAEHKVMPEYHLGDCQMFAQKIFARLTPEIKEQLPDTLDDFM